MFLEKRSLESRRFERHSRSTRCSRNGLVQARRNLIMWFIGLDLADEHHDICVITDAGKQIGSLRIAHSPQRFQDLKDFLYSITGPDNKEEVACIVLHQS